MSLGIAFKGPEGIVLAADSRVTLMTQLPGQLPGQIAIIPSTYDNATKLLSIKSQTNIGAVTYGVGALGQQDFRTAHSLMPEFEDYLASKGLTSRITVQDFAQNLSDFFVSQWNSRMPPLVAGIPVPDMTFFVGGYDDNSPYGRVFEFQVPNHPIPVERLPGQGEFGLTWGGQREYADRLLRGFDDNLPVFAQQHLHLSDQQRDALTQHLKNLTSSPIPYQFLPLQDCVNLSIFLIQSTIKIQSLLIGVRGVGGAIDVATITRTEGFKPIQLKHIIGEE